jgi:hypothetical protein
MYYAIELYEKSDMTIRDIEDSHFIDIVRDFNKDENKQAYFDKDIMAIKHGKMLTIYYREQVKRNESVESILNKGYRNAVEYLSQRWF